MFSLEKLVRPHILHLKPYSSARDEYSGSEGIFLDANENSLGSITQKLYNRYPDPYQRHLKARIGEIKGVHPRHIFLGNGSDEAIDLLFRGFCIPHTDNVIIMPPTYGMYEVSAEINCAEIRRVPLTTDFQMQADLVLQTADENTKMIFICSPNNPTGNALHISDIERILGEFEGIVVVDEAYIDFSSQASFVTRLDEYPNLVVLQTFSKAWGLAALRLGIAFASEALIKILNKIKPPYNISEVTQQLVLESLQDVTPKDRMVAEILQERSVLEKNLAQLPFVQRVYPSDANFLLVRMNNARQVYEYLVNHKIIVRDRSKVTLCEDCLRITVGTPDENRRLVELMKNYH